MGTQEKYRSTEVQSYASEQSFRCIVEKLKLLRVHRWCSRIEQSAGPFSLESSGKLWRIIAKIKREFLHRVLRRYRNHMSWIGSFHSKIWKVLCGLNLSLFIIYVYMKSTKRACDAFCQPRVEKHLSLLAELQYSSTPLQTEKLLQLKDRKSFFKTNQY